MTGSHRVRGDVTQTSGLVRAIARRERVRITVWVGAIALMVGASAAGTKGLFPTQADLDAAAAASNNPAIIAFNGPPFALDTLGGQIAFQIGAPGLVIAALMSIMMIGRLTRGEEEAGRLELVRSLPVGRHAPLLAGGIVVAVMNLVLGALIAIALSAIGLDVLGSVTFALQFVVLGLVFAAVTLVGSQITDNTRLAYGLAGCVLAASFVVRAIGDMHGGGLSWLSPIGWVQRSQAWAGERWWPLALGLAVSAGLAGFAVAMLARRDLGAGLVAPRPGRARARPGLRSPLALAIRLQRGSVAGWCAGVAFGGIAYGSITNSVEAFVRDNPQMADILVAPGGGASLVESYLATSIRITALIGTGYSIQSILRLRSEETALRAEPVLASPVSRTRWAAAYIQVALTGSVVVLAVAGGSIGISAAIATHDSSLVTRVLGASLAYTPAMWVLVAVGVALSGQLPRVAVGTWASVVVAFVITMFAALLNLPQWIVDLSPFEHVPLMPAQRFAWTPIVVLLTATGALGTVGIIGLRRRDIG